jgi:hypothetical protein
MSQKPVQRSIMQSGTKSVLGLGMALVITNTLLPSALGQSKLQPPPPTTPSQAVPPVVNKKDGAPAAAAKPAGKADEPILVQSNSKAIVSTVANKWQNFPDYINLKPGQDSMPLTLTFVNGDGGPTFSALRIVVAGNVLGSDQNFKDNKLVKNMTRAIGPGSTRIIIQAYGPVGAKMTWKLTTSPMAITSVTPDSFGPADIPVVKGKGFGPGAIVYIGKKTITVKSASQGELHLSLPDEMEGGKQDLIVQMGTTRSAPYKVTVKLTPQVLGVDMISAPPGQPIVLSGKNFSASASDNAVTIGGIGAQVTAASPTSLTVVIPEMPFPAWYLPIVVKTNGVESKEKITINLNQRVIENQGMPQY